MPKLLEPAFIMLVLICLTVTNPWPVENTTGQFVLILSVVFLLQTLLRDLYVYIFTKFSVLNQNESKQAQCFCMESAIGLGAVIWGLLLLYLSVGGVVALSDWQWLITILCLLIVNYLLKDFVFSWNPWKIYKDPDHINIIPRLKL